MRGFVLGIVVGLVLAGAAVAAASIPDASGVIHACRSIKSGALRAIDTDAGQTCGKDESALTWNQTGPAGPAGPQGPAGVSGLHLVRASVFVPAGGQQAVVAQCNSGERALGGGYDFDRSDHGTGHDVDVIVNGPVIDGPNVTPTNWQVTLDNTHSADTRQVYAYAVCALAN
jgi:hypothetical protein